MKSSSLRKLALNTILTISAFTFASSHLQAQALWNGNGALDNWADSANWTNVTNSTTPFNVAIGGPYAFQFSNTGNATITNDLAAGYALNSITFLAPTTTPSFPGASSFILTGNSIVLNSGVAYTNGTSNSQRIEMDISLSTGGDRSMSSSGTSTFTGNISGAGSLYITSGNFVFEGVISSAIRRTNGGTLTLVNPNNDFTANITAAAGTLSINNIANSGVNSAIGKGSIINLGQSYTQSVSVATLRLTNDYAALGGAYGTAGSGVTNRTINIQNGTAAGAGNTLAALNNYGGAIIENSVAGQTATFNGNITTGSRDRVSTLGLQGVGNGVVNGAITSQAKMTVTKSGTGTWALNGANTHAGQTIVSGGTLVIGNSQALGSTGFTTSGTDGGTVVNINSTLDLNGQTNVNEVFTLNGSGNGGVGALINNNTGSTASIGNGIASITVTSSSGNVGGTLPIVTITGGGGSGAAAVSTLGVTAASFSVTGGGTQLNTNANGYSTINTIGGGNGASAKVTIAGGVVTGVEILSMGSGFTTAPTVTFNTAPAGVTNPTIVGNNNNFAAEVSVSNAGSGYTSAPTVTLSGPGTNTAVANLSSVNLATASSIGGAGNLDIAAVVSSTNATSHLTKVGAGTLTLTGANTYTSDTFLNAGTLLTNNTAGSATGTGSLTSLTGSNATLGGNGTLLGGAGKGITISQGTNLRIGATHGTNVGGAQLLTFGSALAPTNLGVSLAGTLQFDLFANDGSSTSSLSENDRLAIHTTSTINLSNSILQISATGLNTTTWALNDTWKLIDWTGSPGATGNSSINPALLPSLSPELRWSSYTTSDGLYLTIAAVPEPSRSLLFLLAIAALLRRRRKTA